MTVFFHYSVYGSSNVYLIGNDELQEAVIIDPAAFTSGLLSFIESKNYNITAVLVSHSHIHHVRGLKTLLKIYDARVYASNAFIGEIPCSQIHDGDSFTAAGFEINALSLPGHSADSIVYQVQRLLFTGDTLHAGLVGRTASKYGLGLLNEQVQKKLFNQSDDCIILPGHGPPSTIAAERVFNTGIREAGKISRYQFPD